MLRSTIFRSSNIFRNACKSLLKRFVCLTETFCSASRDGRCSRFLSFISPSKLLPTFAKVNDAKAYRLNGLGAGVLLPPSPTSAEGVPEVKRESRFGVWSSSFPASPQQREPHPLPILGQLGELTRSWLVLLYPCPTKQGERLKIKTGSWLGVGGPSSPIPTVETRS